MITGAGGTETVHWYCVTGLVPPETASTLNVWLPAARPEYVGDEPAVPPNLGAPAPGGAQRARGRLARVGGDEFIVVLTGRADVVQAQWAAR